MKSFARSDTQVSLASPWIFHSLIDSTASPCSRDLEVLKEFYGSPSVSFRWFAGTVLVLVNREKPNKKVLSSEEELNRLKLEEGCRRSHPAGKEGARWVKVATGAIKEIRQRKMSFKSLNESAGILSSAVILGKLCSWQTFIQWPFNSSWLTAGLWCNLSGSLPTVHPSLWREFPLPQTARI